MRLTRQILLKLARLVGAVFAVSLLTFLLAHKIPGDPTVIILQDQVNQMVPCGENLLGKPVDCADFSSDLIHPEGTEAPGGRVSICEADECVIAADVLRNRLDLDKPILTQYFHWLGNAVKGDFGITYDTQPSPVWPQISEAIPPTLELMILSMILSLIIAIPLGIYGAYREHRMSDRILTTASFLFVAIPNFVLAIFLIIIFVTWLELVESVYSPWADGVWNNLKTLAIPAVALAMGMAAVYQRLLRSDMIATLQEDFILTARAKGLPTRRILTRHALRPSSFSLLTVFGINVGTLIGGTVIMEVMFSIPGIGKLITKSIYMRNYPTIQALVVIIAVVYVAVNVLTDICYSVLDPRIRNA